MRKTRFAGLGLAAVALVGGPLGAAPAQAGCVHYVCKTAVDTIEFVRAEATDAHVFIGGTWGEIGDIVDDVLCDVSPGCP